MYGIENYWGFVAAAVLLNLTPGSDTIYILTRSIAEGRKAGMASALGISAGILVHCVLVSLGLAQIVAHSPTLFAILKYSGAAYLLYLGIKMWCSPPLAADNETDGVQTGMWPLFRQGLLTNLLNPKVVLFFLALLPQFVSTGVSSPLPFLLLGFTFLLTGTLWCLLLACAAAPFGGLLRKQPVVGKMMNRISGMVFVGLGLKIGLSR